MVSPYFTYGNIHGDSIKSKPNCLYHTYPKPDHIVLKLSRYSENATNNVIPAHRNVLFNRYKKYECLNTICQNLTKLLLDFVTKYACLLNEIIFNFFAKKFLIRFCFLTELKMFKMSS